MIEDENKIDCIDSLVFGLNRTAEWRKKMAIRYPSDPRNARAAESIFRALSMRSTLAVSAPRYLSPAQFEDHHARQTVRHMKIFPPFGARRSLMTRLPFKKFLEQAV